MRTISLSSRKLAMGAAATLSLAAASLTGIVMAPAANAAAATMTLSAATGSSAGGNNLTATTTANAFAAGFATEIQFKASPTTACTGFYATAATLASGVGVVVVTGAHLVNAKKIAFTVPAQGGPDYLTPVTSPIAPVPYNICVYSDAVTTSGTSTLVASAAYAVAAPSTISSVTPNTGPASGGGTVTIVGTNFSTGTTVKFGSVPLSGVVLAANGNSLTGVVPSQAAGATTVSVTNSRGTTNFTTSGGYTYTNGIDISPDTATATSTGTDIDVQGVGFSNLTFNVTDGSAKDSSDAHVYVTGGNYLSALTTKTHPELGECLNVLVISDTELICTVDPADADGAGAGVTTLANGTYTITVVSAGNAVVHTVGTAGYTESILSSGSTFTVAPY